MSSICIHRFIPSLFLSFFLSFPSLLLPCFPVFLHLLLLDLHLSPFFPSSLPLCLPVFIHMLHFILLTFFLFLLSLLPLCPPAFPHILLFNLLPLLPAFLLQSRLSAPLKVMSSHLAFRSHPPPIPRTSELGGSGFNNDRDAASTTTASATPNTSSTRRPTSDNLSSKAHARCRPLGAVCLHLVRKQQLHRLRRHHHFLGIVT